MAANAKKFEFIMNQDTSDSNDSVKQVVRPEKIQNSSLIALAKHKRNDEKYVYTCLICIS